MFIGLTNFLTNQDQPYTSVTEIAWNMQMSTNDNSINSIDFAGKLAFVHGVISILSATPTDCYKKNMLVNLFFHGKNFFRDFRFSLPQESSFPQRIPGSEVLSHWYDSTPEKSRCKRDSNPGSSALKADALTTRPTRWSGTRQALHTDLSDWVDVAEQFVQHLPTS